MYKDKFDIEKIMESQRLRIKENKIDFNEFIEKIKYPDGREDIAKRMCNISKVIEYDRTLDAIRYLSLPILLMFDNDGE